MTRRGAGGRRRRGPSAVVRCAARCARRERPAPCVPRAATAGGGPATRRAGRRVVAGGRRDGRAERRARHRDLRVDRGAQAGRALRGRTARERRRVGGRAGRTGAVAARAAGALRRRRAGARALARGRDGAGRSTAAATSTRSDSPTRAGALSARPAVHVAGAGAARRAWSRPPRRVPASSRPRLRRFDGILVGGQALSPELRERAEQLGARIVSTYGSSETAGGCVYDGVPIGTTVVREVDGAARDRRAGARRRLSRRPGADRGRLPRGATATLVPHRRPRARSRPTGA